MIRLSIFITSFFDQIEESHRRILFFIDTSQNLTMLNVLISFQLRKISVDFFIFDFDMSILNGVMVQLELFGHDKNLFLAKESYAE